MNLVALLRALRRRWAVVLGCWLLVAGAGIALTATQQKQYSATAELLFRDPGLDQKLFGTTFLSPSRDPSREAATNVKLVSLDVVARRTAERLGGVTAEDVASNVEAAAEGRSDVVSVTATDPDPAFARRLANTFATEFISFRREADRLKISGAERLVQERLSSLSPQQRASEQGRSIQERADQLQVLASLQLGNAELVQDARTPTSPSSPRVLRNVAIAFILGLAVGGGLALLLDRLDRRVREPNELEEILGLPILGLIPHSPAFSWSMRSGPQPVLEINLPQAEADSFRMLRARMRYFNVDREVKIVMVGSTVAGEGKTTVALHLAATAAASGASAIVVEADLRRPTLATRLGAPVNVGLAEVLSHAAPIESALHRVQVGSIGQSSLPRPTFEVIGAGSLPPNPSELIESQQMRRLLESVRQRYDLVIVDTPPLVVSDAIPLMRLVDGVVFVARLGTTTRDAARHLAAQVVSLKAPALGVVANDYRARSPSGYYYGYAATTVTDNGLASTNPDRARVL